MRIFIAILLLFGAHFSLTPFAPSKAGESWFLWPFAADSRPWLGGVGGLPRQSGSVLTPLLAAAAGLGFLAATLGLFGWLVPALWWSTVVVVAAGASILLYMLYFGRWAVLPLALDAILLWGVLVLHWSAAGLRGP